MAYTTYEFYTTTYYGSTIQSADFAMWLSRATDELNYLTFNRITDEVLTEFSVEIQKSTCTIMDLLFQIDDATKKANSTDDSNVKSKSSGNESITFINNSTVISTVLADKKAQYSLMRNSISKYLASTFLLYPGVL